MSSSWANPEAVNIIFEDFLLEDFSLEDFSLEDFPLEVFLWKMHKNLKIVWLIGWMRELESGILAGIIARILPWAQYFRFTSRLILEYRQGIHVVLGDRDKSGW